MAKPRRERERKRRARSQEAEELPLTPMIDISFLMLVFFMLLPFKTLEAKLQTFLPTDRGMQPREYDPVDELRIEVRLRARDFEQRWWGPAGARRRVRVPTAVAYEIGDSSFDDVERLGAHLRALLQLSRQLDRGLPVAGQIRAGTTVPHKHVIAVMDLFLAADVSEVRMVGTRRPSRADRGAPFMRYPEPR
ncbi:MAG: biopolymer transporter ExbD [Planctomycetota bacterium]|nr:biopolymer transporter ExbD [Planctomycetota bacterium]